MRISLSRRERVGMVLLAAMLAAYAVVVLVHRPITQSLDAARERLLAVETNLAGAERELQQAGDLNQRAMEVQEREQAVDALVPGRHSASLFIHYLSRSEAAAGVTIRSIKAAELKPAGDMLELHLEMRASGSFMSHVLFHQNLEAVPLFFRVGAWTLDRQRQKVLDAALALAGDGQVDRALAELKGSPELLGTYEITLYFRPLRAEPGTDGLGYGKAGRVDPFVDDLVQQFLDEVRRRYPVEPDGVPAPTAPEGEDPGQVPPAQLG